MAALTTVSVHPSTLMGPNADAAASAGSTSARAGYPECVLLNKTARISSDQNATTAACRTLDGQAVVVSFWLADSPDVSHFSVHLPGIKEEDFSDPPFIISADGAFVLFCVTLDESDHHFVYSARGISTSTGKKKNKPSLHVLPGPKPWVEAFESQLFGLLPLGDEHYAVAFLDHRWNSCKNVWVYRAHVFSSETKKWRRSKEALLHLSESDRLLFGRHASSKQITVGASLLGWVDLLRGILLLSNLLDERPVITYIPLPAEKVCITDYRGYPLYAPEKFCDVVCCNGLIKFVEIDFEEPDCRTDGKAWKATTWIREVSWDNWRKHRTVDVAQISVDPSYSVLLPDLLDDKKQELELKNLFFLEPTLSVHDDDPLYMLAKVDERDDTAWVLAVDMKHAALQALAPVSTQNSSAITMYYACAFPKYYINNTSDMGNPVEKDKSDKLQQGRPNSNDSVGNLQKKRRKKKQPRIVYRRVEQPFLLYFIGCVVLPIIVKVFCHLS